MKALVLLLSLVTSGCGLGGTFELGGGYVLENHEYAHRYIYKRTGNENYIVIDEQVVGYDIVDDHVLVYRIVANSYDCYDKNNQPMIITHYTDDEEYWIIDTAARKELGPLTRNSYVRMLKELGLPTIIPEQQISYRSNTSAFNNEASECKKLEEI